MAGGYQQVDKAPDVDQRISMTGRVALLLGVYALMGGLSSFAGWVFDVPRLPDWFATGIAIQPNATLCVSFSGLAVIALATGHVRLAGVAGAIVLLIGGSTFLQWTTGLSLGIDSLLLFGREWGRVGVVYPGRMGPPGSFSWTMIGTALVLTGFVPSMRRIVPSLCLITASVSAVSLLGYLYDVDQLYALPTFTVIALQTSTFVMAVSLGILVAHPEREPMRTLLDPGVAGVIARRAMPLAVAVPVVLGSLRVEGQDAGLYDTGLGTALLNVVLIGFLASLMTWSLRTLRVWERRERHATAQLDTSRRAEAERRQELEAVVQAAPAAIWVSGDPGCQLITGNAAAGAMMRMPPESNMWSTAPGAEAQRPFDVYRDGHLVPAEDFPMQTAARTGLPVTNQELEFRFQDGSSTWAYGVAVPLFDPDGRVRGVIATFVDITALKKVQASLLEADRQKDQFLATLGHELRNPLAPIRNGLSILNAVRDDPRLFERTTEMMERQLAHMVRLVNDLLDVSRITRGKLDLRMETVELAPIVHQAAESCRALVEVDGGELTVSLPPEPVHIHADPVRLTQLLGNLLSNACKFTERGGKIRLTAERHGSDIVVTVQDDGIGIPPDRLDDIFEMFVQVDQSLERQRDGLGIGLTLTRRLAELHGGTVEARSAGPGKGSEFFVRLPIAVDAERSRAELAHPGPSADRHRILVVDDNRDSADTLASVLRLLGHETHVAYGGRDAIELAASCPPEVILLDVGMPELNGYDTCRHMRQEPWGQSVAIVALTGWGQDEDRRRSQESGFDAHLVKPVDHDVLKELLALLVTPGADAPAYGRSIPSFDRGAVFSRRVRVR